MKSVGQGERTRRNISTRKRFLDTFGSLTKAIDKALPKFAAARANLVAIADDLFMSALDMPLDMLESRISGNLKEARCACVGGVLFLYAVKPSDRALEYRHYFIGNPGASRCLPAEVTQGLRAGNWRDPDSE
jgi:hypothetical protein